MSDDYTDVENVSVPTGVLARFLDCDERMIRHYAKEGLVARAKFGRYNLRESIAKVVGRLREQAAGRMGRTDDVDAVKSAAELKDATRRLTEIRAAKLAGELISMPEIDSAWREIAVAVKQLFLSFPQRARFDCPTLTAKDQKTLERLARDMLHECATEGTVRLPAADQS